MAIYASLGMAQKLTAVLGDSGLWSGLFILACLLVLATIVTQGLQSRPGGREIAVAFGIAAIYLLVFVRMAIPTERTHLIEYGVVAVFIYEALAERVRMGRQVPVPALFAILITTLRFCCFTCILKKDSI